MVGVDVAQTHEARRHGRRAGRRPARGSAGVASRQRLLEIGDDVGLVLEADRQPHHVRAGAGLHLLRVGQLPVRGRGRDG